MLEWLKQMIHPNPNKILMQQLVQAQLDMIQAQAHKEHWDAQVPMLNQRISRLQREISKLVPAHSEGV